MESVCERPVVWATAQYLSLRHAGRDHGPGRHRRRVGPQHLPGPGRRPRGRPGDPHRERRARDPATWRSAGQWEVMPRGARPGGLPDPGAAVRPGAVDHDPPRRAHRHRLGMGRAWTAIRCPTAAPRCGSGCPTCEMSAAALAILGDYVPFGISPEPGRLVPVEQPRQHPAGGAPAGRATGCCSTSGWTACTTGSATARCYLWSQDGTLLGTASQSALVAPTDRHGPAQRVGPISPWRTVA